MKIASQTLGVMEMYDLGVGRIHAGFSAKLNRKAFPIHQPGFFGSNSAATAK
jgi:hypothetical protein